MTLSTTVITLIVSFLITIILAPIVIPYLRRMKFGQSIREEGPQSHHKKAGTPTMGGLIFLASIIISTLALSFYFDQLTTQSIVLLVILVGFGVIGFLDDFIKVVLKRNLGLTSIQKLIGQILIAVIAYFLLKQGPFDTTIEIPFTQMELALGQLYIAFLIFWLVGFSNAVNLTDGLDGLVAGTATVAFATFGVLALAYEQTDIAIFTFSVSGSLLGFLLFNKNPAKVFMGDTGSLALGGALAMVSILVKHELLLLLVGIIFVIETLSVILQVISFKTTGKRIFKMSPIHHHFELSGWNERKIVTVFWAIGFIAAMIVVCLEVL
ncbi:Phospho-N-acetylmuramoyl-pentapeptide-transferase [Paenisporosarcina quisquiliarum]|jgi:phospho-N-acetylmuramoyl-pentapeptide-transferase|uniref:phospho-N-acetylmuramoyl-pentapeptide- transferase n=1 Tax=Psychrobacillus TaxID=1221880 RepID=UPI0008D7635E|nr:phospho-N-acetylmuramoyl-pentapeptide-transferase [Psychrobacillus psychrodurans]MCK1996255.1 phospho-N-acetylmuramoyl-pentapeptide-transferase [Psychrobacillus psychrodurans]MCZ8539443.1 phospho-N-acetylmuramoyl-pentapeptide-transferase [Psychrobacillus psychrodurans]SEM24542.1 Phospho-N-acetylmuramoyl-pentapeptide-transferase [Paenisporosarcina quisquiliarum]SFM39010.1 phospho-N-acetylmuramoyl-pentapeptide-transferase [Psychrobacillus psychrodurans]